MATAILMLGSEGPGPIERWVAGGRLAAACDAVALLGAVPAVDRIVVAAADPALAEQWAGPPVEWDFDPPGQAFHFGRRLAGLLDRFPAPAHAYLGAGSVPLLPAGVLAQAVDDVVSAGQPLAVTNNLYSSDWMVLNCPQAVASRPERLPNDNALGWVLNTEAGVAVRALPASAATRLDIDTPAEMLLLALHPGAGPELRRFLRAQPHASTHWLAAARRLFAPGGHAALVGRVAAAVWAHLDAHTQSWLRVFSEERGMSASGRQAAGQVKSLLGAHLDQVGPRQFFSDLAQMTEAVFFDTRVLMAHARKWPSPADRYASDLGLADAVADPWLRDFTAAAVECGIPVVMGGHSVVAGGLYALVEIAQAGLLDRPVAAESSKRA